jgi:hypothetical protein
MKTLMREIVFLLLILALPELMLFWSSTPEKIGLLAYVPPFNLVEILSRNQHCDIVGFQCHARSIEVER